MYSEGFKPEKALAHYRTLQALPLILGADKEADADYLDSCRAPERVTLTSGRIPAIFGYSRSHHFKVSLIRKKDKGFFPFTTASEKGGGSVRSV